MSGLQLKDTERLTGGGVAPLPESTIVTAEFDALLLMVTAPVTLPVLAGVNVTVRLADCPELRVDPVGAAVALNPGPEMPTLEIVTSAPPEFVSVTICDAVEPTFAVPKPSAVGFTTNMPGDGGTTGATAGVELDVDVDVGVETGVEVGVETGVELDVELDEELGVELTGEMLGVPVLAVEVAPELCVRVTMPGVPLDGAVIPEPFECVELGAAPWLLLVGLADPCACVAMPVPLNGTVITVLFERVKLSAAPYLCAAVGSNLTVPLKSCPGLKVSGNDGPE